MLVLGSYANNRDKAALELFKNVNMRRKVFCHHSYSVRIKPNNNPFKKAPYYLKFVQKVLRHKTIQKQWFLKNSTNQSELVMA